MRAVAYLRISQDDTHDGLNVGRQRRDAEAVALAAGWDLVDVIDENDTSAFRQHTVTLPDGRHVRRTVRPGFDRLLAGLRQRQWQALVVYHLDRLARQPRDLEDIIELVEQDGLTVRAVSGAGIFPADDMSIQMARFMVAIANQSSRDTSRRVRRAKAELAASGRPNMGRFRPFGYERDAVTVIESEAAVIRQIAEQVLAGRTRADVARGLREGGAPTRGATGYWDGGEVCRVMTNPRYAGLRTYRGEVVGPAVWPAIISLEDHHALMAIAAKDARSGTPQARAARVPVPSLLGGRMLTCGLCGGPMTTSRSVADNRTYICRVRRHVTRSMGRVDSLVSAGAVQWLKGHQREPEWADMLAGITPSRAWAQWQLPQRRQVIRAAFVSIVVLPQGRHGKVFRPELILLTPTPDAEESAHRNTQR